MKRRERKIRIKSKRNQKEGKENEGGQKRKEPGALPRTKRKRR